MVDLTEKERTDARLILASGDPVVFVHVADHLCSAVQMLLKNFRKTPGGNAYVYHGSMNSVDDLKDLVNELEDLIMAADLKPDEDEPDDEVL